MPRQTIVIDPVTRIEGHSKISLHLDEEGHVEEAYFHVTQFRGFEKFCEGRPFYEMPSLMARICGICPVSHLIASAKACDAILAVRIPPNAVRLRTVLNLAQILQSHALSFFYLSVPDLLLGMDSDPATRNVFGVMEANPAMAKDGVRLRQFGQQIIEWLAGKRIHPAWVVPGGVSTPLTAENRDRILAGIPEALAAATRALDWFKNEMERFREEIRSFANFPTLFMGLVGEDGGLEQRREGDVQAGCDLLQHDRGRTALPTLDQRDHRAADVASRRHRGKGKPARSAQHAHPAPDPVVQVDLA